MVIYHFTHGDLDGVGCAVLTNRIFDFRQHKVYTTYLTYQNVNRELEQFVKTHKDVVGDYTVLVTDICPNKGTAAALDDLQESVAGCKLRLFDHHKTSEWVDKYPWATHSVEQCGALLYFDWLMEIGFLDPKDDVIRHFVHAVDTYDRWRRHSPLWSEGEDLNRLLQFLGPSRFVPLFGHDPKAHSTPEYRGIASIVAQNQNDYIHDMLDKQCTEGFVLEDSNGKKYCLLLAEDNISQLCHTALDRFAVLDYVVCVNPSHNTVSMRSRDDGVDVGEIAKRCGGGGHEPAAGFKFDFRPLIKEAIGKLL